jgi:predicted Rossmann fold flavoprotein
VLAPLANMMTYDCIVIGAGAAGLIAAFTAAERNKKTILLEKNARAGVKILMSGGTRCNLTQHTDVRGIVEAYGDQGRFLHAPLAVLSPADLVKLIEDEGVPTKIEETGKIFPVSNQASDVVAALQQRLARSGAELALGEPATELVRTAEGFQVATPRRALAASSVIVTTGGLSYPGSGTTGDGYGWARGLGHTIVETRPALTPLTTNDRWVQELTGLTIPEVLVQVVPTTDDPIPPLALRQAKGSKRGVLAQQRGSFLFTHFGLSGPAVLDVSRAVTSHSAPQTLQLLCDFLPDTKQEMLDERFREECAAEGKRQALGVVARSIPRRLAESFFQQLGLPAELRGAELSKRDRGRLVQVVKQCRINLSGALGYKKAEVTAGGISLSEIDSKTMQSKLVPGLFFAGEVLDLDGPIGGYNFQAAFSTGRLAGLSV